MRTSPILTRLSRRVTTATSQTTGTRLLGRGRRSFGGSHIYNADNQTSSNLSNGSSPGQDSAPSKGAFENVFSTAVSTVTTGVVIAIGGYSYYRYYKDLEFRKMEAAFKRGDPVLDLIEEDGESVKNKAAWIHRKEQDQINDIVSGKETGHYFLIVGEKGTGKTSMILDAMAKVEGYGCAFLEAHADPEIFRIRLGKALNYDYKEDYIGGLFSIRGPRDTTALLDVERAFNKLEKVALKRRASKSPPLLMVINGMHLLRDDEEGRDILELIQQRAEQWAAAQLVTVILNSDDYWVYERLKQYATRMQVIPVYDLPKNEAVKVLDRMRERHSKPKSPQVLEEIYKLVGGRLSFLGQVAKEHTEVDMLRKASEICDMEKAWLLSQCWILGEEMDDDVMDEQKYSAAAMTLARALVKKGGDKMTYDAEHGWVLPQIPLHEARQIMTRADFIKGYDHINVFTIDSKAMVRADSVPMMRAFVSICSQEGFDEHLEKTMDRIAAIESLGRTRELLLKGLSEGDKPEFTVQVKNHNGQVEKTIVLRQ